MTLDKNFQGQKLSPAISRQTDAIKKQILPEKKSKLIWRNFKS